MYLATLFFVHYLSKYDLKSLPSLITLLLISKSYLDVPYITYRMVLQRTPILIFISLLTSNAKYCYNRLLLMLPDTGANINIYVCDTGIRYTHNDFGGRARYYWDFESNVSMFFQVKNTASFCFVNHEHTLGFTLKKKREKKHCEMLYCVLSGKFQSISLIKQVALCHWMELFWPEILLTIFLVVLYHPSFSFL